MITAFDKITELIILFESEASIVQFGESSVVNYTYPTDGFIVYGLTNGGAYLVCGGVKFSV